MRVVTIAESALVIVERPDPVPGPGEVLISVRAAGLNPADALQRRGFYPAPPGSPPDVPGLEAAGEVVALGPGTSRFAIGDRVMGLRVVGRKGKRMRWTGAFLRAVFCTVFPIGLFWCAISRENRSLQDMVLRTSVVHHWPVPPVVDSLTGVDQRRCS